MKYKLIKEYPGSPKLDSIVKLKNNGGYELETSTSYFMTKDKVENYPEFWQEVVEKDYKILSLARFCSIKPTITDVSDYGDEYIEAMLKCDKARIHKIKRLSDGEIFTIGDKIDLTKYEFNFPKSDILIKIKIINNKIRFKMNFQENHNWDSSYTLDYIQKLKQPLFTTEDGVDIFKGDDIYGVKFPIYHNGHFLEKCTAGDPNTLSTFKRFSTKEKAEEYILMNKPCLSLKEIYDLTDKNSGLYNESDLEKLVKQKLNK